MPGFRIYLSYKKIPLCQSSKYTFPEIKEKLRFLKIRKVAFFWENIRNTFTTDFFLGKNWGKVFETWARKYKKFSGERKFHLPKYRKDVFWENIKNFLREKFWGYDPKVLSVVLRITTFGVFHVQYAPGFSLCKRLP